MGWTSLFLSFCLLVPLFAPLSLAAGPTIGTIQITSGNAYVNSKFEISFGITPVNGAISNVFDPSQIAVQGQFTNPSGTISKVNCFNYVPYTRSGAMNSQSLTVAGSAVWLCRFTPTVKGSWSFVVKATDSTNATTTSNSQTFSVGDALPGSHGFIGISQHDPLYFAYRDTGAVYFPIGENLAWSDTNSDTYAYDMYTTKLQANNATYIRIWLCSWCFTVEKTLGSYADTQDQQWALDYVIDMCNSKGIKILLCFDNASPWSSSGWSSNPYKSILSSAQNLWTSDTAFSYFDRRFRHIVARWGYATNLLGWELWNEVDGSDSYSAQNAMTFQQKSFASVRSYDPFSHLISTSFESFPGFAATWKVMDFTMIHHYGASDMAQMAEQVVPSMLSQNPGKPSFFGEFGTDYLDEPALHSNDPKGINLHNEQWGSLVAKAAGGGFSWWWDNIIDPDNQYYHYKGIAAFINGEDLDKQNYQGKSLALTTSVASTLSISGPLDWGLKATANYFVVSPDGTITPDTSHLSDIIYSDNYNSQYENSPTFNVNYEADGQFTFDVVDMAGTTQTANILVDGTVAKTLSGNLKGQTLTASIPKGVHNISVTSTATDWYMISAYGFVNYSPVMQGYALVGTSKILGWVKSRARTWYNVLKGVTQPAVNDGMMTLTPNCGTNTKALIQWWNTTSGQIASTNTTSCTNPLTVQVPAIDSSYNFDWAFKLTLTGSTTTTTSQTTNAQTTNAQTTNAQTTNAQTTNAQTTNAQTTNAQTTNAQTTNSQTTNSPTTTTKSTTSQTTTVASSAQSTTAPAASSASHAFALGTLMLIALFAL